jgi:hypothetical protein
MAEFCDRTSLSRLLNHARPHVTHTSFEVGAVAPLEPLLLELLVILAVIPQATTATN